MALTFLLWLLPMPARGAEATMSFTGALDVAGLLSSITVQPGAVTVPAGGEVAFVNATTATLTVHVGGKKTRVEPGGSASMLFTGGEQAETFTASATSVKLPVVGKLTSSVGRVTVLAAASVQSDPTGSSSGESAAPRPSGGAPGAPGASSRPNDETPDASADATDPEPQPRTGEVVPLNPSGSQRPGATSSFSSDEQSASSEEPAPGESPSGPRSTRSPSPPAIAADTDVPPVLPPFPGFSNTHDQLGLVFLLGAVVLVGLGTALFRTVLAFRPVVEVGAHSQEARKALKVRRRRG